MRVARGGHGQNGAGRMGRGDRPARDHGGVCGGAGVRVPRRRLVGELLLVDLDGLLLGQHCARAPLGGRWLSALRASCLRRGVSRSLALARLGVRLICVYF